MYVDDLAIFDITSRAYTYSNQTIVDVAKTEHLSTRENALQMKLNGEQLKNVDHFKYLGSATNTVGTIERDVDLRMQAP